MSTRFFRTFFLYRKSFQLVVAFRVCMIKFEIGGVKDDEDTILLRTEDKFRLGQKLRFVVIILFLQVYLE
jgi:hypothetical protein